MAIQTALDPVEYLIAEAKRVLPGGSFGNLPAYHHDALVRPVGFVQRKQIDIRLQGRDVG